MAEIPRPPAAGPAAPKAMGRFRCEQRMGGDVWLQSWRARVQGLAGFDQLFALHCLAPGALARRPHAAESLLRAARSTAAIKDPRLATIQDSGLAPGSAYVATELVRGVSLKDLAAYLHGSAEGVGHAPPPLPASFPAVLAHVAAEIAGGLAAAHAQTPVPHGALAPTAVMITPQAGIKIVDLGLRASVLTPQEIAASPTHGPFAAPELARGELPLAADLYSLGRIMATLGGGGAPGRGADAIRALPTSLQNAVRQLLAEDPRQRPKATQAEEMLRAILAEHRGVDVRTELSRMVQQAMQAIASRPAPVEEELGDEANGSRPNVYQGPSAPAPSELFADEPTAILAVSADGRPANLASLLAGMRDDDGDEHTDRVQPPPTADLERGGRREAHSALTPLQGIPVFTGKGAGLGRDEPFEFDPPTVMTSATNLPIPTVPASASGPAPRVVRVLPSPSPRPSALPSSPPLAPRSDVPSGDVASGTISKLPLPSGTPLEELKDLTTEEISASLSGPVERVTTDMKTQGAPSPIAPFREYSGGVPFDGSSVTPTDWRPGGTLDEPVLAGERPGSLGGIEIPTRKRPRHLKAMVAGGAVLAMVAVVVMISAARSPRPQRPVEYVAASEPPAPTITPIGVQAGGKPAEAPPRATPSQGKAPPPAADPQPPEQRPPSDRQPRGRPVPTRPPGTRTVAALPGHESVVPAEEVRELEIRSTPSGATVLIAGKERGTTPAKVWVPTDVDEIRLLRPGYEPRTVKISQGTDRIVEATLDPVSAPAQPAAAPTPLPAELASPAPAAAPSPAGAPPAAATPPATTPPTP